MVEVLKNIYLMDKKFEFIQKKRERFIYKFQDVETGKLDILELQFNETEQKIKKIDIYSFSYNEAIETIHITRSIDNITSVDYYALDTEYINMDGNKEEYGISIYKTYSEIDDQVVEESVNLDLIKKGHKKHKSLKRIPLTHDMYTTSANTIHQINSSCIRKLEELTKFLVPSLNAIENNLFNPEEPEPIQVEKEEEIENSVEEYPKRLFIYDRYYELLGLRQEALIYRNTDDDILDVEVYFNKNKDKITEVRILEYSEQQVDEIKTLSKNQIIRIVVSDNGLNTTLVERKKGTVLLNGYSFEKSTVRAMINFDKEKNITKNEAKIDTKIGTFYLYSKGRGFNFVDKNGENYEMIQTTYLKYKILLDYIHAIINNLENELIYDITEEKILSLKNNNI